MKRIHCFAITNNTPIMKKSILVFVFCSFFVTCEQGQKEPEIIVEPEPCGCCEVKPIDGYVWYRPLSAWDYPFHESKDSIIGLLNIFRRMDNGEYQIPEDVLSALTTEELVEICFQVPAYFAYCISLATDWGKYPHCNDCMDYIFSIFNGFRELYSREDFVFEIFKRYDDMICNIAAVCSKDAVIQPSTSGFTDASYKLKPNIIQDMEMLIGHYRTDNEDAIEIYTEILRRLMDAYHAMLMFPEVFKSSYVSGNYIARMNMIENITPGTLMSKVGSTWYSNKIPCYYGWNTKMVEGRIVNELSYELIK
jgi:hypothetical protein